MNWRLVGFQNRVATTFTQLRNMYVCMYVCNYVSGYIVCTNTYIHTYVGDIGLLLVDCKAAFSMLARLIIYNSLVLSADIHVD